MSSRAVVSVLYQGSSPDGSVPDAAGDEWHIVKDLPQEWKHTGGGFCKFMSGVLDMDEEYEGPCNGLGEARALIDSHFNKLFKQGFVLRYALVEEKWSFHAGGFSANARMQIVNALNLDLERS
jgi:hypothetical protein